MSAKLSLGLYHPTNTLNTQFNKTSFNIASSDVKTCTKSYSDLKDLIDDWSSNIRLCIERYNNYKNTHPNIANIERLEALTYIDSLLAAISELLTECIDGLGAKEISDLKNEREKLERQRDGLNEQSISHSKSSVQIKPRVVSLQKVKLPPPSYSFSNFLNDTGKGIGDTAQNVGIGGLLILGGVAAWVFGSGETRSH
jgi:hypothetical protein